MTDSQEPEHEGAGLSNQKKVIFFSRGEALTDVDSDEEEEEKEEEEYEEEEESSTEEAAGMFSVRNLVQLIGRLSLRTYDFIGGALGLNASKFQYAVNRHNCEQESTPRQTAEDHMDDEKTNHDSKSSRNVFHGATGDCSCSDDAGQVCDDTDVAAM
nr:uncharacterized protein LOC131139700 isoform X2 [Doryrhamphus excisus]XP_057945544.1 uncharacterized protein LOC131139700 isoform X2 [Doryrhamphus excisus]XP_057945553.1 uncharacterized protein LOC131139700 isoform X2 [Doryrhamphus excisus]XP_057945561.1 uncharacterized protein LOC131139700 isoform X2 [Doryrhamphus excisus]XP_057945570.1 uncharacterized protein LOC131139700 isoform X2 [Doryrhamphus excisus]